MNYQSSKLKAQIQELKKMNIKLTGNIAKLETLSRNEKEVDKENKKLKKIVDEQKKEIEALKKDYTEVAKEKIRFSDLYDKLRRSKQTSSKRGGHGPRPRNKE